jgi:WXXGXW repeat (2 copies)
MQYLGRVVGIAVLALGTTALSGCYAPPPVAAVTPDQVAPAYPPPPSPPAYPPVAAVTPGQMAPTYPPPAYPLVATATPTPLTPPGSDYNLPQYGSTTEPAMAPSSAGTTSLVAPYAPPPLQAETPPPPPSPLAMWQPGHWSWNGSQYLWTSGHYIERPNPSANWQPGYWQQRAGGWIWVDGHWIS